MPCQYSMLTDGLVWLIICAIMTDRFVQLAVHEQEGEKNAGVCAARAARSTCEGVCCEWRAESRGRSAPMSTGGSTECASL
jgi:hypothetical protein